LIVGTSEIEEEYPDFGVGGGQIVGLEGFDQGNGLQCFGHGGGILFLNGLFYNRL
jgi:hypothetical protein